MSVFVSNTELLLPFMSYFRNEEFFREDSSTEKHNSTTADEDVVLTLHTSIPYIGN
jgi:hypothetical protein